MISDLKTLIFAFPKTDFLEIVKLQMLIILMSMFEVVGILSIIPFIEVISNPVIINDGYIAYFYNYFNFKDYESFVLVLGFAILSLLFVSMILLIITTWNLARVSQIIGRTLSTNLFNNYVNRDYLSIMMENSNDLINNIAQECNRVTHHIIYACLVLNSKIILILFICTGLFFIDPKITLWAIVIFCSTYLIIFTIIKKFLARNSQVISIANAARLKVMSETFQGIREVKLSNNEKQKSSEFNNLNTNYALSVAKNILLGQSPRFFVEFVVFFCMISYLTFVFIDRNSTLIDIAPMLSAYALGGLKLLPAFQQAYAAISQIHGNKTALATVAREMTSKNFKNVSTSINEEMTMDGFTELKLDKIKFDYPGARESSIGTVDLTLQAGKCYGIVGESGSGKSTLTDIIVGLLRPTKGTVTFHHNCRNVMGYRPLIAYVSQDTFLSDDTIFDNISYGYPKTSKCLKRVIQAAEVAQIDDFIKSLPEGYDTIVGEHGVMLSGGQRQRLGIARAIYKQPEVIILDEATSALDVKTEDLVIKEINSRYAKALRIMIAHRLTTVRDCDEIFLLEQGRISASGTYWELRDKNNYFRNLTDALEKNF